MENKEYNFGYNAQTGEYVDMMSAGIIWEKQSRCFRKLP